LAIGARHEISNNARKTMVCVDSLEGGEIHGRVYHPRMAPSGEYAGVVELATRMEELFNRMSYPQSSFSARRFCRQKNAGEKQSDREVSEQMPETKQQDVQPGEKATFIVEVQFRQNATWQGTVSWVERKKKQRFRSVLELIKLMNDALDSDPQTFAGWDCQTP
jgi:hypothetical protein